MARKRYYIHITCLDCQKEFKRDKHSKVKHTNLCSSCVINKTGSTHRKSNSKTYYVWENMKQRCLNPNHPSYKDYGERGIKICERWKNSFENFLDDMGESPKDRFLDRIDNMGNYEPKNCKWSTRKEQQNNMRRNRKYTFGNLTKSLAEWCDVFCISTPTVYNRLRKGWHIYMALSLPVRKRKWRNKNGQFV